MSSTLARQAARLTLTLADGTVHSFTVARMPACWRSWLLQQLPYGTDTYGCSFSRERTGGDLPDPVHHHDIFARIEASTGSAS